MQQQNAGASAIKVQALQDRAVLVGIDCVTIVHADELQAIDLNFFIVQHANASPQQRRQIFRVTVKLFMISRNVINAQRCRLRGRNQVVPRLGKLFEIGGNAVIEIARDENDVILQREQLVHHAAHKAAIAHMPKMEIANQRCCSSTPLQRQIRQRDGNAHGARPRRIEQSIKAGRHGRSEGHVGDGCCMPA